MDKQTEILASALKLFVEFGFHGTPTSKIAKEAGVANGTLFHYYSTKDELIVSLFVSIKMRMAAHIEENVASEANHEEKFKNQFVNAMYWALENKNEFKYIQQFYASPYVSLLNSEEIKMQLQKSCDQIEDAIKAKIIKPMPAAYINTMVTSHLFGLNQYLNQSNFLIEEQKVIINDTFDLLWDMLT